MPKICGTCGKSDETIKMCNGCYKVSYCSRECQLVDWIHHKENCYLDCKGLEQKLKISKKQKPIIVDINNNNYVCKPSHGVEKISAWDVYSKWKYE